MLKRRKKLTWGNMDGSPLTRAATAGGVEDDYFTRNPAPASTAQYAELAAAFAAKHSAARRRVALVTSGGTTVPLENQTVRFIDNFSAGTRGATSAEYFLAAGYAVVFLHRRFSLLPYARHYSHATNCFLDFMAEGADGRVFVRNQYQEQMRGVLRKYQAVRDDDTLLLLPFTTVNEYLWALREMAYALRHCRSSALLYLAAAVSDFFVPRDRLAEHKIQSSAPSDSTTSDASRDTMPTQQKLVIDLDMVPKFLKQLVEKWAPNAMIISFKLETDPSILISKARKALERYSHHLVIGNILNTRSFEVVFVTPGQNERWIRIPSHRRVKSTSAPPVEVRKALASSKLGGDSLNDDNDDQSMSDAEPVEIESLIVPECIKLHDIHIQNALS